MNHLESAGDIISEDRMCLNCKGRGYTRYFTEDLIIPDKDKTLVEITKAGSGCFADQIKFVEQLHKFYDFEPETAYKDLPEDVKEVFLYGSGKELSFDWESKRFTGELEMEYEGIIPHMERALKESKSAYRRKKISNNYMSKKICEDCNGFRINEQARTTKISGKHIGELAMLSIDELLELMNKLKYRENHTAQGNALINEILIGLEQMVNVGLSYLHLNRRLPTLSGGELQRLSLMTHLDAGLDSLIYVLDEPSMSLHEIEKASLINILKKLKDLGNTVLIVEHDKKFIEIADEIIDIGPEAGTNGGEVIYYGDLEGIKKVENSPTGKFLDGRLSLPQKNEDERRIINDKTLFLSIKGVSTNNLKNVEVKIPLGMMIGICGVSGSGKSSLIQDTLVPLIKPYFKRGNNKTHNTPQNNDDEGEDDDLLEYSGNIDGWQHLDEIIIVDQKPIARVRTSTPCTYIEIWGKIRKLFSKTDLAKKRGYKAGHFSYNSDKGRCPACKGQGIQDLQISFLSSFEMQCKECKGLRYKPEIIEVEYKGKNISEVLNMTVSEALELFEDKRRIARVLRILEDVGMGYMTLGQPSPTLSGGEAQRVKLAKRLGKAKKSKTLYILDEPTVGLSFYDAIKLMELLERLVVEGNTVLIIEHDPDILSYVDYLIELGPEGGPKGGYVIAEGTPEEVKANQASKTGPYLN
ncbi:MAG: ATP-binding cassette domain-containing protein [Candidatus Lokiarchaeota archaeon]|nr:ATP-binding cassette domain-containing protein [Candidatus Lokiarchaeota archaeon]MBD3202467.1 ATP-binding cassette domain-containing protein [Candidatus Lokiarchaeota archaeon]